MNVATAPVVQLVMRRTPAKGGSEWGGARSEVGGLITSPVSMN